MSAKSGLDKKKSRSRSRMQGEYQDWMDRGTAKLSKWIIHNVDTAHKILHNFFLHVQCNTYPGSTVQCSVKYYDSLHWCSIMCNMVVRLCALVLYSTVVQWNTIQWYSTIWYSGTAQYGTVVQCSMVQWYSAIWYSSVRELGEDQPDCKILEPVITGVFGPANLFMLQFGLLDDRKKIIYVM